MTTPTTQLHLGPGLDLPLEAVTETFAILAKRGSGKTYLAAVMVEEMLEAGLPVCVVDPIGVWFGLRSSADGKKAGQPVVIFGGDHADVPLQETAGKLIASVLVEQRFPAVLDLSHLSKSAARRFMADFAEQLYHSNREALHLVLDEADSFAPQRTAAEGARLLGAIEDLVRRGRARGIGVTLITQRPAVLNKDVLTQAEVLIALRMTGPRDVAAIDEWVRLHADEDEAREVKASLPALPIGTAWVWSPGWLGILQRVAIRKRRTFDSSATPKVGEAKRQPARMADVDLDALGEQIAATAEKAKADDPKALRARVAELERQLTSHSCPTPQVETVEVPAVTPDLVEVLEVATRDVIHAADEVRRSLNAASENPALPKSPWPSDDHARLNRGVDVITPRKKSVSREPVPFTRDDAAEIQLKAGARRLLETLARHHPMRVTKSQLGTLAKFKITGGTFQTYWSQIRRLGLVDESDVDIGLTDAGFAYLGDVRPDPMTTDEILDSWRSALKAGARAILDELVAAHPSSIEREDLAARVNMTASGGTFQTYVSTLRRNGLAEVRGSAISASSTLFLGGAA